MPGAASAKVSGSRANTLALRALRADVKRTSVVVFREPTPVRPGTRIASAGAKGRGRRLRTSAWLYWADLAPTADFQHPSVTLALDALTGRVVLRQRLMRWPLVNRRLPAFLRSPVAYYDSRFRVLARGDGVSARAAPDLHPAQGPPAGGGAPDQCVILVGPAGPFDLAVTVGLDAFPLWDHWIDSDAFRRLAQDELHVRTVLAATDLDELKRAIEQARGQGCSDVNIFMTGEGSPPPRFVDYTDPRRPVYPGSFLGGLQVAPGRKLIRPDALAALLADQIGADPARRTRFTVIMQSCFAGRMLEDLRDVPTVRAFVSSAGDRLAIRGHHRDVAPFVVQMIGGIRAEFANSGGRISEAARAAFDKLPASDEHPTLLVDGRIVEHRPPGPRDEKVVLQVDQGNGGTVAVSPAGKPSDPPQIRNTIFLEYLPGTTVTLTATPKAGYSFLEWSGGTRCGDNPSTAKSATCTFTLPGGPGLDEEKANWQIPR